MHAESQAAESGLARFSCAVSSLIESYVHLRSALGEKIIPILRVIQAFHVPTERTDELNPLAPRPSSSPDPEVLRQMSDSGLAILDRWAAEFISRSPYEALRRDLEEVIATSAPVADTDDFENRERIGFRPQT